MRRPVRHLFLLFAVPFAMFAANLVVRFWRFLPDKNISVDAVLVGGEILGGILFAAVAGALALLFAQFVHLLARRRNARKAECFLVPALAGFTLVAVYFLWAEIGLAATTRGNARMDRAWEEAKPQTQDDVRRLFGEPDWTETPGSEYVDRTYRPTRLPCPIHLPFQVVFDKDGNIRGHGHRGPPETPPAHP